VEKPISSGARIIVSGQHYPKEEAKRRQLHRWCRSRAGKEPVIGHIISDCRMQRNYLSGEEVLIISGIHQKFVMTGGVMSWHDLALHLIARYVGPMAAQTVARFLMLQWHAEGQAPYITFSPKLNHNDALILSLQKWLHNHFTEINIIEKIIKRSGLARRTIERRFREATGYSPLSYIQNLRIAEARSMLEQTNQAIEKISFNVGYENTAFFRRLFKRITRLTPGAYRRKFQIAMSNE